MVEVALISSSGKTSWLKRRCWPTLLKTMEYPLKSVTYVSRLFCNLCVRLYRAIFNRRALTDVATFFALPEVMLPLPGDMGGQAFRSCRFLHIPLDSPGLIPIVSDIPWLLQAQRPVLQHSAIENNQSLF